MNQTPLATPDSRPWTARAAARAGGGQFPWGMLVSRTLHPIKVEVIEEIKALAGLGALRRVRTEPVQGESKHYYVPVERSRR